MITTPEEYYANLFLINKTGNLPSIAHLLPSDERTYHIDLNSKIIEAPEFLSVNHDHYAETIYFTVDRYFDNVDLATTSCVIQYINAKGEGRIYSVPFYDIETYYRTKKILIPWCIEGEATKAAGDVTYAFRFFQVDKNADGRDLLTFNLNTLPATSKVLHGLNILDYYKVNLTQETYEPDKYYIKTEKGGYALCTDEAYSSRQEYYAISDIYNYPADDLDAIKDRLNAIERDFAVYWMDAGEISE